MKALFPVHVSISHNTKERDLPLGPVRCRGLRKPRDQQRDLFLRLPGLPDRCVREHAQRHAVLSGDTYCNVSTPVSVNSGTVSGAMATDCGVVSVAMVNDPSKDTNSLVLDPNKNSESECTFILANNGSTIVAAFDSTHLDQPDYGGIYFPSNVIPRTTWWAISTNGGLTFTNTQPLPPTNNLIFGQGDAPNPAMTYDLN